MGVSGGQGKLVARQVFGVETQGRLQGVGPGVQALPRQTIDQVQPQVGETRRPDQFDGRGGLRGSVAALKEAQFGLVKGLDPQAEAVDPQVPLERQLVRR